MISFIFHDDHLDGDVDDDDDDDGGDGAGSHCSKAGCTAPLTASEAAAGAPGEYTSSTLTPHLCNVLVHTGVHQSHLFIDI